MGREERMVAEAKMRRRDREQGRVLPAAFLEEEEDFLDESMPTRRRRKGVYEEAEEDDGEVQALDNEALKDVKGLLSDYVLMEAPGKSIRNEFHRFLTSFVDEGGVSVYGEKIRMMAEGTSGLMGS